MEKQIKMTIDRWIKLSTAIKKMYLKIITLEQQNLKESDEYKNLIDLLPTAVRIENSIINEIFFTKDNYEEIKEIIDENIEQIQINMLNGNCQELENLRRSNKLDEILLSYNNFFELHQTNSYIEAIKMLEYEEQLSNFKYVNEFLNRLTINHIAIIERWISKIDDKKLLNYLIALKYQTICITPKYENIFVFFNCKTHPPININQGLLEIDSMTIDIIRELNEYNLRNGFKEDLMELLCLNNNIIDDEYNQQLLYRLLTLNEARLISLNDISFIQSIYNEIIGLYPDNEEYSKIIELIDKMFDDAIEYIKEKNKLKRTIN